MSQSIVTPGQWLDQLEQPTWRQIGITSIVLILSAAAAITLDNLWGSLFVEGLWRRILLAPLIIVYTLLVGHFLSPYKETLMDSLRQVSALDEETYDRLIANALASARLGALLVFITFFFVGVLLSAPWETAGPISWIALYITLAWSLMLAMLARVVYSSLRETGMVNAIQRRPLKFDILYITPFVPIARYSLRGSLAFIGGSTIAIIITTPWSIGFTMADLVFYGILVLVAGLVFFVPMLETHRVLRQARRDEMDAIRYKLAAAYRRLEALTPDKKEDILIFSTEVNLWESYEQRIKDARTWPYDFGMIRTLVISTLIPILVSLGQRFFSQFISQLLP